MNVTVLKGKGKRKNLRDEDKRSTKKGKETDDRVLSSVAKIEGF